MRTPSQSRSTFNVRRFFWGALSGALFFFSGLAAAGGIAINPIRLELDPGQRTASMTVTNDAAQAKVLQVTVTQWRQVNGESVYDPASDVIATPLLFRIPPKSHQLVRVGFATPPSEITTERSYRIYLTEVPEDKGGGNKVRFLLRIGIPLFFPPAKAQDSLNWQLTLQKDGKLLLSAENSGNRHVRLQSLRLEDSQGSLVEEQELNYLLPGSRKEWLLTPERAPADGKSVKIKAQSGRGVLETEIPIGAR
jgi:fimbrial chaperone protein